MSRALVIIQTKADRDKASRWAQGVPVGSRIEFKETKRSLPQNDRLWAMLTDVAIHMKKQGRDHTPEQWKVIFMAAFGHEVKFLPTLDQKSFIPLGHSSSDLSVREMTDLIEFMHAWGAEAGVVFNDPKEQSPSGSTAPEEPVTADVIALSASAASDDVPPHPSSDAPLTERDMLIKYASDVLPLAAQPDTTGPLLSTIEKEWATEIKAMSEDGQAKAKSIAKSMRAIFNQQTSVESALEYFAEVLETTVGKLRGEING